MFGMADVLLLSSPGGPGGSGQLAASGGGDVVAASSGKGRNFVGITQSWMSAVIITVLNRRLDVCRAGWQQGRSSMKGDRCCVRVPVGKAKWERAGCKWRRRQKFAGDVSISAGSKYCLCGACVRTLVAGWDFASFFQERRVAGDRARGKMSRFCVRLEERPRRTQEGNVMSRGRLHRATQCRKASTAPLHPPSAKNCNFHCSTPPLLRLLVAANMAALFGIENLLVHPRGPML